MKAAMVDYHFAVPTARLRVPIGSRGSCCDSAACDLCPTEAKFTALNTFGPLIARSNVDLLTDARVLAVEMTAGKATGLRYARAGRESLVKAELVAVGCNALYSPFILMRSGLKHDVLGKFLHENVVLNFEVELNGLNNFDGGTPSPGHNISWIDGEHRRESGGAVVYFSNNFSGYGLRTEWGRWRQTLPIEVFVEDLPQESNMIADEGGQVPTVKHDSRSNYALNGVERVVKNLPVLLSPLPVERIIRHPDSPTGFHIQGTCRMGKDPASSIVDANLVHHSIRNLLVLGTAVWPSCGIANPSLTAAALSLRAAARLAS